MRLIEFRRFAKVFLCMIANCEHASATITLGMQEKSYDMSGVSILDFGGLCVHNYGSSSILA